MTRRGWVLFSAMAVIWGIPYLLIKIAVGELTPASLVLLRTALGAALLGVVCTALAFLLFFSLIGEVGPVRATVITYFNPAIALALGVALLHEPFTLGAVVGFSLILLGSVLATRRTSEPAGAAAAPSSRAWGVAARDTPGRQRQGRGSRR